MFSGPLAAKKEEEKCSYLLIWCDEKGRDIANTWIDVTDVTVTIKRSSRRISRDLRIMWNRNAIFPLQVSQKSTSRIRNGRTVRNGPEASGERLFLQGTRRDDPWQNCFWNWTNSCKIREKLLVNEGKELTLDKAVDIARTYELSQSQIKSMEAGAEAVHSVNRDQRSRKDPPKPPTDPPQRDACGRYGKTQSAKA